MTRRRALAAWLATVGIGSAAFAQRPVDPSEPLPQGHPPVQAPAPQTQASQPRTQTPARSAALPENHPPVGSTASTAHPPAQPSASGQHEAPADRIVAASDLPAGTAEVVLLDGTKQPIAGRRVTLVQLKQSVEEGDSTVEQVGTTDPQGRTRFSGLATQTAFSYRAVVQEGPARYATDAFRLDEKAGQRATLHVFPVVRDINQALIGMRGVVYVSPREDIFQIEQQFQIFNIGQVTWVPNNVRIALPTGAKAFSAGDSMTDATVEHADGSIELRGTFPPGQREITFRFQLDNTHDARRDLQIALPPHVAEMRVLTEAGPQVELKVKGFPDAQSTRGKDGNRLLLTGVRMSRGQPPLTGIDVTISGLPVPSKGRWYAVGLALFAVVTGLVQAVKPVPQGGGSHPGAQRDMERARALLLDELILLEQVRRDGGVGPRTYEQTRSLLLDALARIHLSSQDGGNTAVA